MTLVIVIIVLLLSLAFFYLKCSLMQSLMTLWSAILATIIAFSFYESTASLLISRGIALDWALAICFTLLFVFAFAIIRIVSDYLVQTSIDLGDMAKLSTSLVCGFLTGLIISGNILVALGLLPMHGAVFYSRFDPEASDINLDSAQKPLLATDGFVAGLYSLISSGSMSSQKSFGVLHADYLSQIHLNKLKVKEDVLSVSSPEALVLPTGKTKKPIRRRTIDDKRLTIVRAGIKTNKIEDGGAGSESGKLSFFPAQIRIIVKESGLGQNRLSGTATALYPIGIWKDGKIEEWTLNQIITPDSKEIQKRIYWVDLVFPDSHDKEAVLLDFKQNAVIQLPGTVDSTPEIERALDDNGQEE